MTGQFTSPTDEDRAALDALFRKGDEAQELLDLQEARDAYVLRHPLTARGAAQANSANAAQGKAHVETESVPTFVKFVAKAAKLRNKSGFSASKLTGRLACADFLGRDFLLSLVGQPRVRRGLLSAIAGLVRESTDRDTPMLQEEREDRVDAWLAEEPIKTRKTDDQDTLIAATERIKAIIEGLNDRERDQLIPVLRAYLNERDGACFG